MSQRIHEELKRVEGMRSAYEELNEAIRVIASKGAAQGILSELDAMSDALRHPDNHSDIHSILDLFSNTEGGKRKKITTKEYESLRRRIERYARETNGAHREVTTSLLMHDDKTLLFLLNQQYPDLVFKRFFVGPNSLRLIDYTTLLLLHKEHYKFVRIR